MQITYRFRCDPAYFKAVISRQYRQGPFLLRLPVQFGIVGAIMAAFLAFKAITAGLPIPICAILSVAIFCLVLVGGVVATKHELLAKSRRRPGFGSEVTITLSDSGLMVAALGAESTLEWSAYPNAVRFDDGILLKRARSIRWLPDSAIQTGSTSEATRLVESKTAVRHVHRS